MSEQGLSIFDDEPEQPTKRDPQADAAGEETRVLPRVPTSPAPAAPPARPAPQTTPAAPLPVVR
ncbi:MAG: hypothetical protein ACJ72L_13520, partial [Marmoricola sp.]